MDKILLVGCGAMGGALKQGWLAHGWEVMVVDPHSAPGAMAVTCVQDLPSHYQPDFIFFAVKPQQAAETLPHYAQFNQKNVVFVSIMAGISIAQMQQYLGPESILTRAMPNLPCVIGQGMTGLFTPDELPVSLQKKVTNLFLAVGTAVWMKSEADLNAVTAVSGSGPAYAFHLVEMMAKAGETLGLPHDVANQLARQTLIGAGAMLAALPDSAAQLRQNVTSPEGTTAAAIQAFDQSGAFESLVLKAVTAAYLRAQELSS